MSCILVIDDSPTVRSTLQFCLQTSGFEVLTAGDGRTGLAKLAEGNPRVDLVLVDFNMPIMDGIAVCRAIRADPSTEKLPIILMTGFATKETLARASAAGFQEVVTKPFVIGKLLADLKRHLAAEDCRCA
ncbi:MAG TPA: response regulator [Opitutaceae bacterium]|jgi:CheY-like chemotaxis protein|nr:response regulator [Opitutaceae bacterium]